ncbi:tumor necrosis factor receptor superfamily member 21 [Scleropages formosus]|uniref:Tumor necrosis factor receptor superfamily, member 21 n=1 Tax=Scleropages formosus TaxID=113540 RepID=A0A8C9V7V1_SCLFO|nr:tumor necrosis factor receptor superfamily member 21 [Scleropages formosus]
MFVRVTVTVTVTMTASSLHAFLALLLTHLGDISAQALGPSSATDALSARHYQHTDPGTGAVLLCDKCPAGTYVSKHCTESAVRECESCPEGTFTRGENGVQQCHRCRKPCQPPLVEKSPCTGASDRACVCPPGTFANGATCRSHTACGKGWGVRKKGSEAEDVKCKPCPTGTFSDVSSSVLKCRTHTNCTALGLPTLAEGTRESDGTCGPPSANALALMSAPLSPAQPITLGAASEIVVHKGLGTINVTTDAVHWDPPPPSSRKAPLDNTVTEVAVETEAYNLGVPPTEASRNQQGSSQDQRGHQPATKRAMDSRVPSIGSWPIRRGSPRPGSAHSHFDINEHLPWMVVLLLLLTLITVVVCSMKRSSRALKKGPPQDPSSIMEKAIQKKPASPAQVKEKWIYHSNGQGVDILKLVSSQIGSQWVDIYRSLANATEREVAAFSSGYSADCDRAYAALQHWTVRDADANLAKLINALHRERRIDVVEKIRCVMDNPQFDLNQLMTPPDMTQCLSPTHKAPECPVVAVEQSPVDRSKGFFGDESEPLLRCDSTSSKDSALSRTGSFITKEKKDTVLRQVRLDPCDLQPIFDDMLHILNPEELHVIEEIPMAEDKLDRLFEIAGVKSQEASQTLLDSVYGHLPDLL